jgi:mannose-6-phosphate isomerase class I
MAFAYRPIPFDDPAPVNRIEADLAMRLGLAAAVDDTRGPGVLVLLDGVATARFDEMIARGELVGPTWNLVDVKTLYRSASELEALLSPYLPMDRDQDPELIFGRLFDKSYDTLLDEEKVRAFLDAAVSNAAPTLLYGLGSASDLLRSHARAVLFADVTPKDAALRAWQGYECLGGNRGRSIDQVVRQSFFIDLELSTRLRTQLITTGAVDGYILDSARGFQVMRWSDARAALAELASGPFRAKPVYVEGVWGGQFIKQQRGVPDHLVDKVAWAFELLPTEASVLMRSGDAEVDIPFMTVMDAVGEDIIGKVLSRRFDGRFPVRFNYDDTWHSSGNLSIQVHPGDEMIKELHGDIAGQNEAYYVVLTGHGAKTYVGFKGDGHEFLELCRQSERDGSEVPYEDYIYGIDSEPGRQVFLPYGTVHASGRNQLVLELGTITTGAYTYKLYDYVRPDITGKPRPIHTMLGERALAFDRDVEWVNEHVAFEPQLIADGPGWADHLVGRYDGMYMETHRVEISAGQAFRGENLTGFTVLTLVDGETARIQSPGGVGRAYEAGFLDVVVVPASMPSYEVVADPRHPIVIHKTTIRADRYEAWQND